MRLLGLNHNLIYLTHIYLQLIFIKLHHILLQQHNKQSTIRDTPSKANPNFNYDLPLQYLLLLSITPMQKHHETSPHRALAILLFDLIHELSSTTSDTLNAQSLASFLKCIGLPCQHDLVKFMHTIDKYSQQMRRDYWGVCISQMLVNNKFACEIDYEHFHQIIKTLINGTFVQPLENYQKWDGNFNKQPNQKDKIHNNIVNICRELSLFIKKIDFMMINSNIRNINTCFSLITLLPQKKQEIYQIYENILAGNFLETLQLSLTMSVTEEILIEMLKSLCYLYQSLKYKRIRKILQSTFLMHPATLKGLMQNINDQRPNIRYYTCALMSVMVNYAETLRSLILSEKNLLYSISNGISQIREEEGLIYGIEFLIGIIREFSNFPSSKIEENRQILSVYLNFAVQKLWQLKSEQTQQVCIKLVAEMVKVTDFFDQDLKLLKFVNNVFEGSHTQKFQTLFQTTLTIARNAMIFNRKNVRQFFITDSSFQNYLKHVLKPSYQKWQPFYSALQIILILSQSQTSDILFQRDLIPSIFSLSQSNNVIIQLSISEIILALITNSLEAEWKITYLYEKDCLKVIGTLLSKYYQPNKVLQNQYPSGLTLSYNNRQVLVNCLKSLSFLNYQSPKLSPHKKKQLYAKNFSNYFITALSNGFLNYFTPITNKTYLKILLREEHSLDISQMKGKESSIKMFKLMSKVVEQMTQVLRKRNTTIDILKEVNQFRNEFHRHLYQMITYAELTSQNIPVYLLYMIQISGSNLKLKAYRLPWLQFKLLVCDFIRRVLGLQAGYFRVIDKSTNAQIRGEEDYRRSMERILGEYSRQNFVFDASILDIAERQDPIIPITPPSLSIRKDQDYRSDYPKFYSYRMPQVRDLSPFSSRKMGNSMTANHIVNSPCRQCHQGTSNRSQICNFCVQNHTYR